MSNSHVDTYFINSSAAIKEAHAKNRVYCTNKSIGTQICYYSGEKLHDAPMNCINVPISNVYNYFTNTSYRSPLKVSYAQTILNKEDRKVLTSKILNDINQASISHRKLIEKYKSKIKQNKPNFKEKQWRVFIPTSRETAVMQHVSKHIRTAFRSMGYKVLLFIEKNDLEYASLLAQLKAHDKFNPHITINLNHFNSDYLHKKVCNVVWIQDPMESITNTKSIIDIRKRDIIYSLAKPLDYYLENKKIPFRRQNFAINKNIYKKDKSIKREKKVVFVGSSYLSNLSKNIPSQLIKEVLYLFSRGHNFDEECVLKLAKKYNQDFSYLNTRVISFVIRDFSILELCKIKTNYQVEIYGWGWDKYPEVIPFYKGVLKYGKDIAKVFNSARYSLSPHSGSLIQQRVLESAACGCIPIVYDCKVMDTPPFYSENLVFYKQLSSLKDILNNSPKRKLKKIVNDNSYKKLAKRIIKEVKSIK